MPLFCAADVIQSHNAVFTENASPSSPGTAPTFRGFRRASEVSITSQVSGMADSYTASNIANSKWGLGVPLPAWEEDGGGARTELSSAKGLCGT